MKTRIILISIFILGTFLRFYNLNWDNFLIFHPDERNIANAVTKIIFFQQLNPGFFAYGGLPIYLYRATADLLLTITGNTDWVYDWGHINLIGRFYSATFSSLTTLFTYLLSKKFLNKIFSLISTFIFAFSVSSIQIAHFATTESLLILVLTLVTYFSLLFYEKPNFKKAIMLGFLLGIGAAAKTTALSFTLVPALSFFLLFLKSKKKNIFQNIFKTSVFIFFSIIVFLVFSPYTFLSWDKFIESMRYESGVVSGKLVVPYTHQFDKAIPYIFEFSNFFWQVGYIFIVSIIGFCFIVYLFGKKKKIDYLFILLFPILYFLYVGSWHTKFIRYTALLLPFLSIYASYAFWIIYKKFKKTGLLLLIIFLSTTVLWVFSFMSVYMKPQTRFTASLWMYKNIKPNEKVYTEHWDDGLPIHIEGINKNIQTEQLKIYENEFNNKTEYYAEKLSSGDYIILVTRRHHGTLINLPETFPVTSKYYKKLFTEDLGYKKVAEFSSYPNFLGFEINDDVSEESFQVYDHPKVMIFKNVRKYTQGTLWNILKK